MVGRERRHPFLAERRLVIAVAAREDRALRGGLGATERGLKKLFLVGVAGWVVDVLSGQF